MKILIIYVALIAVFYFVDKALNLKFVESEKIQGECEERLDNKNETVLCCAYIWKSEETMVTFYFKSAMPLDFIPEIGLFYQKYPTQEPIDFQELMNDTKNTFPFVTNEAGQEEFEKHDLHILNFEFRNGSTDGYENYLTTPELTVVSTYILLTKGLIQEQIEAYYKNNLKYLEDSFVTFLCFVIMIIAIKLINEEEDDIVPLGKYIRENQPHLLLMIVLIAQPLRPLCYFPEFEAVEWLIGQTCYAVGEFLFLRYFLQILSFLKGQNNKTNKVRNTLVAIFVIIPISIDRWLIAFNSQSIVIKDLENQVDGIETIMKMCWICFLLYSSIFAYEIMISLQSHLIKPELFIIDIIFFIVYALQKGNFYLYYENYDHHLFNPINMLMMVSYIAVLLTLDMKKQIEKDSELTTIRHQLDQDEEHGENLDSVIAEYYKEKSGDDQTLI